MLLPLHLLNFPEPNENHLVVVLPSEGSLCPDPLKRGGGEEETGNESRTLIPTLHQTPFSPLCSIETWIYYQSIAVGGGLVLEGVERIYHYTESVFGHRGFTVNMRNKKGVDFLRQITVIRFGSVVDRYARENGLWGRSKTDAIVWKRLQVPAFHHILLSLLWHFACALYQLTWHWLRKGDGAKLVNLITIR